MENILGIIDNITAFGLLAPKRLNLIVTNERLLLVNPKSGAAAAQDFAFSYMFGIFGRMASNRLAQDEMDKITKQYSPEMLDQLLQSNKDNVAIPNMSVDQVTINRRGLMIKAQGRTYGYQIANPNARKRDAGVYEQYLNALHAALGAKVVEK